MARRRDTAGFVLWLSCQQKSRCFDASAFILRCEFRSFLGLNDKVICTKEAIKVCNIITTVLSRRFAYRRDSSLRRMRRSRCTSFV